MAHHHYCHCRACTIFAVRRCRRNRARFFPKLAEAKKHCDGRALCGHFMCHTREARRLLGEARTIASVWIYNHRLFPEVVRA